MGGARTLLDDFLSKHSVEFVPSDLPALKSRAASSEQVTDIYLAELASAKGMKLATLDTGIKHSAVEAIQPGHFLPWSASLVRMKPVVRPECEGDEDKKMRDKKIFLPLYFCPLSFCLSSKCALVRL
jgi:hypothetical protein